MGNRKKIIAIVLAVLAVLILAAAGSYYIFTSSQKADREKENLQRQVDELKKKQGSSGTQNQETASTNTPCASTITDSDKIEINLWKTYTNKKYKLSFKYPETWEISKQENEYIELVEKTSFIRFLIEIGKEAKLFDYSYFTQQSKDKVTISCVDGEKTSYNGMPMGGENDRIVASIFTKGEVDYLILVQYRDYGASLSSDIVEAYDLILKTIEFK